MAGVYYIDQMHNIQGNRVFICPNEDLNYFFNNYVSVAREDSKRSYAVAEKYVRKLLEEINRNDKRFDKEPIKVGSASQGLKVDAADEFDINVRLLGTEPMQWGGEYDPATAALPDEGEGYVCVIIQTPIWMSSRDVTGEGIVIASKVRQTFKRLLTEAVDSLHMNEKIHIFHRHHGPAITINIEGSPRIHHDISVDLAPMFQLHLSFPASVQWPHPWTSWPPSDKVEAVKRVGVNAVAKGDTKWLISYNEAEKELRRGMDEDGGCRAKVHRIMKKLKDDVWSPSSGTLSSYHLKNLLFWECERFPTPFSWTPDRLCERFDSILTHLEGCLYNGRLPMYFNPRLNLLESKKPGQIDLVRSNITKFRANPKNWLRPEKDIFFGL